MTTFEDIQKLRANTTKPCLICNTPVSIYRVKDGVYSNKKRARQVCDSNDCLQTYRRQKSMEKNGVTQYNKLNIKFSNCVICGTKFRNSNNHQTCSKKCAHKLALQTTRERYGVDNIMQSPEIKAGMQLRSMDKYGVPHPVASDVVRGRRKATMMEKYGVAYPYQLHIPPATLAILEDKSKLEQYYVQEDKTLTQIGELLGVDYKTVGRYIVKHGLSIRHIRSTSQYETQINDYVVSLGFETNINVRNILPSTREIDVYVPDKKLAIEFNGLYWHSEQALRAAKKHPRTYHLDKVKEAESVGVHLIHIFEDDWTYKQNIVKSRLRDLLGVSDNSIFARKCIIKEVSSLDTDTFLNTFHIQGTSVSTIRLGLYYNDELVSLMTFGSLRKALGQIAVKDTYELVRFCSSGNVVGGASKLFAHFIKSYAPKQVVSYADRHWTTLVHPNLYDKLDFTKVSDGTPNYWYIVDNMRVHRFNYRKSELHRKLDSFDINSSEYVNMLNNGFDRIWGCGSLKYVWNAST